MIIQIPASVFNDTRTIDTTEEHGARELLAEIRATGIEDDFERFSLIYQQIVDAMHEHHHQGEHDVALHEEAMRAADWFIRRRVTKLLYDATRRGWEDDECQQLHAALVRVNANFKGYDKPEYAKYISKIEMNERDFYGTNISDDSDSDKERGFFSDPEDDDDDDDDDDSPRGRRDDDVGSRDDDKRLRTIKKHRTELLDDDDDDDDDDDELPDSLGSLRDPKGSLGKPAMMDISPPLSPPPSDEDDDNLADDELDQDDKEKEQPDEDDDVPSVRPTYRFLLEDESGYPDADTVRSQMSKQIRSPFDGKSMKMRTSWAAGVSENASIHDDQDWTEQALKDLQTVNEALAKGDSNVDNLTKTRFCVAQYRGIAYNVISFSASARRNNRDLVELRLPVYASSVFAACGVSPGDFYAGKCAPDIASRLEKTAHELREILIAKRHTAPIQIKQHTFDNHAYALQDLYTKDYDGFHEQLRLYFSHLAALKSSVDPKPSEHARQELWPLFEGLLNDRNPFVSTGSTPRHALRYAYGIKYYEGHQHERLRPRWRKDGRAERPYAGKVYVSLHPLSDYQTFAPLDVIALNRHAKVNVVSLISAEREASFPALIERDRVIEEHVARYPSFRYKYAPYYYHKYGLLREEYGKFRERIVKTAPHSGPHKKNKLALGEWLTRYYEARLVETARRRAKAAGMLLVYRNEEGFFGRVLPTETGPIRSQQARTSSDPKSKSSAKNKLAKKGSSIDVSEKKQAPSNAQSGLRFEMLVAVSRRRHAFGAWFRARFNVNPVPGDGNCLFHALSRALQANGMAPALGQAFALAGIGGNAPYDDVQLRALAVWQLTQEGNTPQEILTEMAKKATHVLQTDRWGTDREVGAVARALGIAIRIYSPNEHGGYRDLAGAQNAGIRAILHHGGGDHWEWAVPKALQNMQDQFQG
ncbi:MAG: hypothetical protein R3B70_10520 [Polyangiaceae bacterium]